MPFIRLALFVVCAPLAACGGNVATSADNGNVNGSAGTSVTTGTTTGGMMTMPGAAEAGMAGSAGASEAGGGLDASIGPAIDGGGLDASMGPALDGGGGFPDFLSLKSAYGYSWKDSWFIRGCPVKAGAECITEPSCPNQTAANFEDRGSVITELFPLGGAIGTTYAVSFQVNGIAEAKYYEGGVRDAGDMVSISQLDLFYRGGTPVASTHGVMRMRVLDPTKKELARYYMNSAPMSSGWESRRTLHVSYAKTIDVPGAGFVEYLTQDSDCRSIDNCGDGEVSDLVCTAARGIPHEEANPLPAMGVNPATGMAVALATLNSVNGSTKPWHSQIVHVTITNVVAK